MKSKRGISIYTLTERIIIGCTLTRKDEPRKKRKVQETMLTTESDKDMLINLNEH